MKRTDLVKNLGMKIRGQMQRSPVPERFAAGATEVADKRAQRKAEAAAKLVPFAVRLPHALVVRLREQAVKDGVGVHELTARLLQAGLGEPAGAVAALDGTRSAPTEAEHTNNQSGPVKLVRREAPAGKPAAVKKAVVKKAAAAKKMAASPAPAKTAGKAAAKIPAKTAAKAPGKTAQKAPAQKTTAQKTAAKKTTAKPPAKPVAKKSPKSA